MIPHVEVHQTTFVMMGDRIVKCVRTLPNDEKDGIHQTKSVMNVKLNSQGEITNIDECKWDFVHILTSHDLNCE